MRKKVTILCIFIFILAFIVVLTSAWLIKSANEIPPAEDLITTEEITHFLSETEPEYSAEFVAQCEEVYEQQGYLLRKDTIRRLIAYIKEKEPELRLDCYSLHVVAVEDGNFLAKTDGEEILYLYGLKEMQPVSTKLQPGDFLHVIATKDTVLQITEREKSKVSLRAAWIKGNSDGKLTVTYNEKEFAVANYDSSYTGYEDIVDLRIEDGGVSEVSVYTDKVNARILSVKEREIELEGLGTYPYAENIQVYKLFGEYEAYTLADLKIGYAFTDFVLNDSKEIVAALVSEEGYLDKIRIVIKTTGFESAYHEKVVLSCDTDVEWSSGEKSGIIEAGEKVSIDEKCEMFGQARITLRPVALSAKVKLHSVERNQGTPAYRGVMEVEKTSDGLVVINELSLDEYLYSVVPSEMPASYPLEALKAQAVSARTYAYAHMLSSRLQRYGAHVDDSAAFQVYNNIMENEMTTRAVRDTEGIIVAQNKQPVTTYFYSTSCGYGTDLTAWMVENDDYLQMRKIGDGEALDLTDEEVFADYIKKWDDSCYEVTETYFRWKYETIVDEELLLANLQKRYVANPDRVLTKTPKGYISKEIKKFGELQNIIIEKRAPGGVVTQILLVGSQATLRIMSEINVRYILAGENTQLWHGEEYKKEGTANGMLPSAFLMVEAEYEPSEIEENEKKIVSYRVYGGGFGHGIGMSQNGAKQMAKRDMTYDEILKFFYADTELLEMKKEEK